VRKTKVLTHERFRPNAAASESRLRELVAVREILHALLHADRPQEVFQFALDRISPLVGATFSSIYLLDGVGEVMQLAAAHNWPPRFRQWMGETRVRLGFGPSGEAAAERRVIEVPDVFADPDLEDWQEVATELGFRSLVALPMQTATRAVGTVTFYFAATSSPTAETRAVLRLVADEMAVAAERAAMAEELRRKSVALAEAEEEAERQAEAVLVAQRARDEFLANVTHELRAPLTSVLGYLAIMQEELAGPLSDGQREDLTQVRRASEHLLELIDDLLDLTALKRGTLDLMLEEFDPCGPLDEAVAMARGRPAEVALRVEKPESLVPMMRSDRKKITRILVTLLGSAYSLTSRGEVVAAVEIRGDRAVYRVQDTGLGIPRQAQGHVFEELRQVEGAPGRRYGGSGLGLTLARGFARLLGGEILLDSAPGEGSTFTVELPLEVDGPAPEPGPPPDFSLNA
jgi:signal transduction histidine kinase